MLFSLQIQQGFVIIDNDIYLKRRSRFASLLGENIAVIPTLSGGHSRVAFRPDSDFWYLTGFPEPDALLAVIGGGEPRSILFCKEKNKKDEIWHGDIFGSKKAKEVFGFEEAYPLEKFDKVMPKLLARRQQVYFDWRRNPAWTERMKPRLTAGLSDPALHLSEMRLIKDSVEISLMRYAAKVSALAHKKTMRICKPEMMEYELEAELAREFRFHGSSLAGAYPPIVASGNNACTLHYGMNKDMAEEGALVLIDAGCEVEYYASDVTRTFPVSGKFSKEQRIIYEIVLEAQNTAICEAMPGSDFLAPHRSAIKVITKGLKDIGLLKGRLQKLIESNACARFFPHGTSHWLGLDVHDAGVYKIGGKPRELLPGMLLTVEPGIYIPRGTKGVDKKWQGIGVRVEDDILITEEGNEVLSADAPKSVSDIERTVGNIDPAWRI